MAAPTRADGTVCFICALATAPFVGASAALAPHSLASSSPVSRYLAKVYPTAILSHALTSNAHEWIRACEVLYESDELHALPHALRADVYARGEYTCGPPGGLAIRRSYGHLFDALDCTRRSARDCLEHVRAFRPRWLRVPAPVFVVRDTFIEVTCLHRHRHGEQSLEPPRTWAAALERSPAGWHFVPRKGTGIFYRTGRGLFAPFKNQLLHELLRRLERAEHTGSRLRTAVPAELLPPELYARGGRQSFMRALNLTIHGTPCSAVGIKCARGARGGRGDAVLDGAYDALIIALGRALGFATLGTTASPLDLRASFGAELMDLRLPPDPGAKARLRQQAPHGRPNALSALMSARSSVLPGTHAQATRHRSPAPSTAALATISAAPATDGAAIDLFSAVRRHPFDTHPTMTWTHAQAQAWVSDLVRARRLTLRDPFATRNESRARACDLPAQPTLRLACFGHVSWQARSVPSLDERQSQCRSWQPVAPGA